MTRTTVESGPLLQFLRNRAAGPADGYGLRPVRDLDDLHDEDIDAELADRLQETYANALPGRLAAIARSTSDGDARSLAAAATVMAGTSGQLGHPEVAAVCRAIAEDARRGILAHAHLVELRALVRD